MRENHNEAYSIRGGKKSEKDLVIKALWFAKDYLLQTLKKH